MCKRASIIEQACRAFKGPSGPRRRLAAGHPAGGHRSAGPGPGSGPRTAAEEAARATAIGAGNGSSLEARGDSGGELQLFGVSPGAPPGEVGDHHVGEQEQGRGDDDAVRIGVHVGEQERQGMSEFETEVIAALPEKDKVKLDMIRMDAPKRIPKDRIWVFYRKEPLISDAAY